MEPIRKEKDNRLIAMMQVRNEVGRYLEKVLTSLEMFADEIVIIDDASTDETPDLCQSFKKVTKIEREKESLFGQEWKLRGKLWDLACSREPDWILAIDADEIFETRASKHIRNLIDQTDFDQVGFRFYDFWGSQTHYRSDHLWQLHQRYTPILIRYFPNYPCIYPQQNHHVPRLPISYLVLPSHCSDFRVKHLGWSGNEEERRLKYERYIRIDPQGKWGNLEQYHSILDRNPNLLRWEEETL
ncbi:Glycosyl transferase family 2 [Marininema mesophilum]|uniref:Glycosyl transferase family 2 n=1 Tax=Marininema mesophilum TaxID=1048340 RepID=A0A1H3BKS7_9BACL|nr:glycosyltransferase [Marininema mesophilum]SDX41709.1 Glycosyl transferase family 2 [Marininema mesophilum]